jgi:two-component sensor histidine kinase/ABC-type amino acid transport substrate-binding protein
MVRLIYLILTPILCLFLTIGFGQAKIQFTEIEKHWIQQHPVLKFGYDPAWPPYEIFENNEYKGIVKEYISILERETGIQFVPSKHVNRGVTTLESLLENNTVDFIADIVTTEKRKKELLLTTNIASEPLIIATRIESNFVGGLSKLKGKRVAVPFNYYSVELLSKDYPDIQLVELKSMNDCLLALSSGQVDAAIEVLGVVSYNINHFGFTNIKIAAPTEYKNIELCMAFNKQSALLHGIVQKILNHISVEEHNKIRQKWIAVTYDHKNDYSELMPYLKIIGISTLILLLILFFWNRSLKKHIQQKEESELKLKESLKQVHKQHEERKLLLKEIHHRVKNNLQIVSSLLKLQVSSDQEQNIPFNVDKTIDRIQAIGHVHEKIYQSPNLNETKLKEYITSLVDTIIVNYTQKNKVRVEYDIEPINIDIENMIPLAIILNEFVINSLKHGLKNKEEGYIYISFKQQGINYILNYSDNGKWVQPSSENRFGKTLIDNFINQLNGKYTLTTGSTTNYIITFPIQMTVLNSNKF